MAEEFKIVTPVGMLGYGYPTADFWRAIDAGADAIVIDSGSTDNGPQELGLGKRTSSKERCTPLSVAAHTLYEKSRADLLAGPGGVLDLNEATYTSLDDRTVRVEHSVFRPTPYTVKLEGASIVGHRTVFIGGIRDPILIEGIDGFLDTVRRHVTGVHPALADGSAQLIFHVYGKNGVMGALEPIKDARSHELCILAEVIGPTQDIANAICNTARVACLHAPYPGQMATGGNMAFPLTPMENEIGPVCAFSIYHLMEVDSPTELFPVHRLES